MFFVVTLEGVLITPAKMARNHGAEGGFELTYSVDNTQVVHSTPDPNGQKTRNPRPLVRLLYDARLGKETILASEKHRAHVSQPVSYFRTK